MAQNGRSRFEGFLIGDRVCLVRGAVDCANRREPLPRGACGTVVGCALGLPQVDFGDGTIVIVPSHYLDLVDLPDGVTLPDNGDSLFSWDVYAQIIRSQAGGAA